MGALIAPEYRPRFGSRPIFEQPRDISWVIWNEAVREVMADCPVPFGLYNDPEPWVMRPNPISKGYA